MKNNQNYDLSEEEQKLLSRTLANIEKEIYRKTLNKIKISIITVGLILSVGGIFTFSNIKTSVVNETAKILIKDDSLRTEIVQKTELELEQIKKLKNEIEADRIVANKMLKRNLQEIREMLEQIYVEENNVTDEIDTETN